MNASDREPVADRPPANVVVCLQRGLTVTQPELHDNPMGMDRGGQHGANGPQGVKVDMQLLLNSEATELDQDRLWKMGSLVGLVVDWPTRVVDRCEQPV